MRLKEPLEGVKLAGRGHPIIHLILFLSMYFVDIHDEYQGKPEEEWSDIEH